MSAEILFVSPAYVSFCQKSVFACSKAEFRKRFKRQHPVSEPILRAHLAQLLSILVWIDLRATNQTPMWLQSGDDLLAVRQISEGVYQFDVLKRGHVVSSQVWQPASGIPYPPFAYTPEVILRIWEDLGEEYFGSHIPRQRGRREHVRCAAS